MAAKVQARYAGVRSFEAGFDQRYDMKAFGSQSRSTGRVRFQGPDKMFWEYAVPQGNLVVSDGVTLWSYVAKQQDLRQMKPRVSSMPVVLAFLGKGGLSKDFSLTLLGNSGFANGYVLQGVPRTPTNLYSVVRLYVDGSTFEVRRVVVEDAQGNTNRFDFTKQVVGGVFATVRLALATAGGTTVILWP